MKSFTASKSDGIIFSMGTHLLGSVMFFCRIFFQESYGVHKLDHTGLKAYEKGNPLALSFT